MTRWIHTTALALLWMVVPATARAQATMYLVFNDESACTPDNQPTCRVSRLLRATLDGANSRVDWQRTVPFMLFGVRQVYVTPDAGSVVWLGVSAATGPSVFVHDVATGQTATVGPFNGSATLLGNPVRPEVYLFDGSGITVLAPSGVRRFDHGCSGGDRAAISNDGKRASYWCRGPSPTSLGTAVFDTATGSLVSIVPAPGKVSADGTETFTYDLDTRKLQRRSLATGQVLAEAQGLSFDMVVDPVSGDVLSYVRPYRGMNLLDRSTLTQKWTTDGFSTSVGSEPAFAATAPLLVTIGESPTEIDVFDTIAQRHLVRASMRAGGVFMAFAPPSPAAPVTLTASIQGATVQLSWAAGGPPAAIARYVVEVGSAPGLNDIIASLDAGLQTSFAASGAPPGRYYVRVRAGNYSGLSAPSNELVVQVP